MESKSSTGLLGIIAIAAIVLFAVMAGFGPQSRNGQAWNYLMTGNSSSSNSAPSGPSVVGGPSLSANRIDTILADANSPAQGSGAEFVLDSAQFDINDAVALAFFHHESSYGTSGMATQTHSIGNIVCTAGYSCIGRFRAYPSWEAGIDDWFKLIKSVYVDQGLTTLDQIVPVYAPAKDHNSPGKYIASVQADINAWRVS